MTTPDYSALDSAAKANLDVIFSAVHGSVIRKPNINGIYFQPSQAVITCAPHDLQLEWLFKNYNSLALTSFDVTSTQDPHLIRGLWFYALDPEHSFAQYYKMTRYNLVGMAYVWSLDFPADLCGPGDEVREFVHGFIDAWFGSLRDTSDDCASQEKFIHMWMNSGLDLFIVRDKHTIQGLDNAISKLTRQSLPPSLRKVVEFEAKEIPFMREEGKISQDEYDKYGPSLILHYVLAVSKLGQNIFVKRNKIKDIREARMMEELAKRQHNGLAAVDWDSEPVRSLVQAVDPSLPAPKAIQNRPRSDLTRVPWMDVDDFFRLLRSGFEKLREDEENLASALGGTTLA
ncbi:hypothetical protein J4E90_009685 [Alternaria incomplexa]|uniref:uncharacterized protein n=1 Tax=Alternaria incomplexa TaxID=1187928 RepID=UPI00222113DB|nr:uncharacterized protein J4E90_009685 [Alternaria incomplexa]KAI4907183.1 hypothetical protein J4E90_009685 [Alternaria incomplexa]